MQETTRGIVLRSVKYGETSLITTIFTSTYGVQAFMVQGVRSSKSKTQKAGFLQPSSLLDLVIYRNPQANLQRLKEFHPAHIYISLQEEVVKNSIALFSVEVLLRLLPEQAPMPELFDFVYEYFCRLDKMSVTQVANFPLHFLIECSKMLGYEISGTYTSETPHLNLQDGAFTAHAPSLSPFVQDDDAQIMHRLLTAENLEELNAIEINSSTRYRLLDWYLDFMHNHTQHMGTIKSLAILRAVLH